MPVFDVIVKRYGQHVAADCFTGLYACGNGLKERRQEVVGELVHFNDVAHGSSVACRS